MELPPRLRFLDTRATLPSPLVLVHGAQFSFDGAKNFGVEPVHTIEEIVSLGSKLSVKVRGDGNCFFSATTIGALLGACCQEGASMMGRVFTHFDAAVRPGEDDTPWGQLPLHFQVTFLTSVA